jgi:hypothetical protein
MPLLLFILEKNSKDENDLLHKYAESIIIKGVKSGAFADETALFCIVQQPYQNPNKK